MSIPNIHQSWQRFKIGLTIFVVGAVLLFSTGALHEVFYYLSLVVLLGGFGYAMWGYMGIFLQRFSFIKNKKSPPKF
ncbi:hypothetical protein [Alteromonas sp. D210916BOD_24]|uniref:hypothetical protein n=1 Tax=Alteromonas sp. D210916BOD_24 TaxID=3157618 RepID=UPI00399CD7E8